MFLNFFLDYFLILFFIGCCRLKRLRKVWRKYRVQLCDCLVLKLCCLWFRLVLLLKHFHRNQWCWLVLLSIWRCHPKLVFLSFSIGSHWDPLMPNNPSDLLAIWPTSNGTRWLSRIFEDVLHIIVETDACCHPLLSAFFLLWCLRFILYSN